MEWSEQVFPLEGKNYSWSEPSHHITAYSSGKPVAHLGFGSYPVKSGKLAMQLIGVGGVVVRPEMQGRRIPRRLFEALHSTPLLDARDTLCTLFCPLRLESYYAGLGYRKYTGEVFIPGPEGSRLFDFSFMMRGDDEFSSSITLTTDPW